MQLRELLKSASALFLVCFMAQPVAQAKDLTNRLGIGFSNQFSQSLPSVSAYYYPNPELGLGLALGVNTEDDDSKFGLQFKIYRVIFPEDNMNFYMGASAGLLSYETSNSAGGTDNESGFELNGFFGGEFFFAGLDSLAFRFEAGLGIVSVDSGVTFRTIGDSPINAGVTFYF